MINLVFAKRTRKEIKKTLMGNLARRNGKETSKTGENTKEGKTNRDIWEMKRKKTKQLTSLTIQLEETGQKILMKEGRLKRCRYMVKEHKQNITFQNNERKFY